MPGSLMPTAGVGVSPAVVGWLLKRGASVNLARKAALGASAAPMIVP